MTKVNDKAGKLKQSKKYMNEHTLDVNPKDPSPEHGRRTEKEVGRNKLQRKFKSHLSLARVEGWASRIEPGKKQHCFRTQQQQEECFRIAERGVSTLQGVCPGSLVEERAQD